MGPKGRAWRKAVMLKCRKIPLLEEVSKHGLPSSLS